jgi:hypothetical protein
MAMERLFEIISEASSPRRQPRACERTWARLAAIGRADIGVLLSGRNR